MGYCGIIISLVKRCLVLRHGAFEACEYESKVWRENVYKPAFYGVDIHFFDAFEEACFSVLCSHDPKILLGFRENLSIHSVTCRRNNMPSCTYIYTVGFNLRIFAHHLHKNKVRAILQKTSNFAHEHVFSAGAGKSQFFAAKTRNPWQSPWYSLAGRELPGPECTLRHTRRLACVGMVYKRRSEQGRRNIRA